MKEAAIIVIVFAVALVGIIGFVVNLISQPYAAAGCLLVCCIVVGGTIDYHVKSRVYDPEVF